MKSFIVGLFIVAMVGGLFGCGKTIGDIRADGAVIAETGSSFIKKAIDAGIAVYSIVKNVIDDVKDNVVTVKDTVMGTPPAPVPPSQ